MCSTQIYQVYLFGFIKFNQTGLNTGICIKSNEIVLSDCFVVAVVYEN